MTRDSSLTEFHEYLSRQRLWSLETFGDGKNTQRNIDHITEELEEIRINPDDPVEWVDVILLAIDGIHRLGYETDDILDMCVEKIKTNLTRTWDKRKDGRFQHHINGTNQKREKGG